VADTLEWMSLAGQIADFLGIEAETLTRQTHIYDELGLDSLGMFSLGMHLVKSLGIALPLSEVANISTLGDIYDAFARHRGSDPTAAS
jgi:acyl carrier protein